MEDNHDQQRRPHGLLPDLRQFPVAEATPPPYPPLPHYYPNLLVHPPPDSIQTPTLIYSEPFSVVNNENDCIAFVVSSDTGTAATADPTYGQERESNIIGFDLGGGGGGSGSVGSSRWPRQETLTLLEIRSRLANKFREANQKGPLWEEVSRIMSEEHRYQRSGKKCREKFENLYKYYKKTKEGKAGRQDGKNYRFFRQLEAIYGESSSCGDRDHYPSCYDPPPPPPPPPLDLANVFRVPSTFENEAREERAEPPQYSPSFSNSMSVDCDQFDTSSEEENDVGGGEGELSSLALMMTENKKMRRSSSGRGGWKEKVKKFVDVQVSRLVDKQEEWMDKMMSAIECNERERVRREIEWREQELSRFEREREIWAKERAWMESRDASFMDAMRKLSGKESAPNHSDVRDQTGDGEGDEEGGVEEHFDAGNLKDGVSLQRWQEPEMLSFIQVMTSMEPAHSAEGFWDLIGTKMVSLGYSRSAAECRTEWENIGNAFRKMTERDRG